MAKKKIDNVTLRAGDIHEPESIVRDDYTKPTFAEMEMKLQGTKAYEYNARKTVEMQKKPSYKETLGHSFFWFKQIHLPIIKHSRQNPKLTAKGKKKEYSILAVVLVAFLVGTVGYVSSNWESVRQIITTSSDEKMADLPFHEMNDNKYDTGAQCVGSFLAFVAEGDAPNAMGCLDSYSGTTYFRRETEVNKFSERTGSDEAYYARMLLRDLYDAYKTENVKVKLGEDIIDYSFYAGPNLAKGRSIISVDMEIWTESGYQVISMNIPTVTRGGNYYIAYEAIK